VVGCVDTHLHVGPDPWIARLVADYAFVLQSLLAEATGNNAETRRDLDLWLGRLTQRCDSDAIKCIPWFTGPGCALVRLLVEHNWSSGNIMRRPCDMFPDFRREWLDAKKHVEKDRHCLVEPAPVVVYDGAYIASHLHPRLGDFLRQIARNDWFYVNGQEPSENLVVRYPRGIAVSETPDMKAPPWTFDSTQITNSHIRRVHLPGACTLLGAAAMDTEIACYWTDARDSYCRFVSRRAAQQSQGWWH
jgi:hypothetical protein